MDLNVHGFFISLKIAPDNDTSTYLNSQFHLLLEQEKLVYLLSLTATIKLVLDENISRTTELSYR